MKTKLPAWMYLAAVFFLTFSIVFGSVRIRPEQHAMNNIRFAIDVFKNDHGRLPKDWNELISNYPNAVSIFNDARNIIDFEKRYQIIHLPTIHFSNRSEKLVVMAKAPGWEGNTETPSGALANGRLLIVEMPDGTLETRRYSENALRIWFEESNLDLSRYTSEMSPPPKGKPKVASRESRKEPQVIGPSVSEAESTFRKEEEISDLPKDTDHFSLDKAQWLVLTVAVLGTAIASLFLWKRRSR